jgi:citrate lyase beta subunit
MVGTMIEVPRGALTADEIAQTAEFFSFGTNDLTLIPVVEDVSPRHLVFIKQCFLTSSPTAAATPAAGQPAQRTFYADTSGFHTLRKPMPS